MYQSFHQYQNSEANKILTASPEKLIAMLLDGVITETKKARERFLAGQTLGWKESVNRAMRIVNYLSECLDMEKGGEIAENLERLYFFSMVQLYEAGRSEDPSKFLDNVESIIGKISSSWNKISAGS